MKKRNPKTTLAQSGPDVDWMKVVQDDIDRMTRHLAEAGTLESIQEHLQEMGSFKRQLIDPVEEHLHTMQRIGESEGFQSMFDEAKRIEALVRNNSLPVDAIQEIADGMQKTIDSFNQPFGAGSMADMVSSLSPTFNVQEYVAFFDFQRLHTYIEDFDAEDGPGGPPEGTETDDEVLFEASIQIQSISAITDALIKYFARHPKEMRKMPPRRFEELVAELVSEFGFDVELTPATRDGGRDVIAVKHDVFRTRHLIECKRYSKDNPVRVHEVRALYGVLASENASQGVMVTTSRLTSDAQAFVETNRWRLESKELAGLKEWILEYLKKKSTRGRKPPG